MSRGGCLPDVVGPAAVGQEGSQDHWGTLAHVDAVVSAAAGIYDSAMGSSSAWPQGCARTSRSPAHIMSLSGAPSRCSYDCGSPTPARLGVVGVRSSSSHPPAVCVCRRVQTDHADLHTTTVVDRNSVSINDFDHSERALNPRRHGRIRRAGMANTIPIRTTTIATVRLRTLIGQCPATGSVAPRPSSP